MKTFEFNFNPNPDCCFAVRHYYDNPKAIAISIIDSMTDNELATLTVFDKDFDYEVGNATISYDDVFGDSTFGYKTARKILTELGIIKKVWETYSFDDDTVSADVCTIDLYKLKEYSKTWDYWTLAE